MGFYTCFGRGLGRRERIVVLNTSCNFRVTDTERSCARLLHDTLAGGRELVYLDDRKTICSVVDGGDDIAKWSGAGKRHRGHAVTMPDQQAHSTCIDWVVDFPLIMISRISPKKPQSSRLSSHLYSATSDTMSVQPLSADK